MECTYSPITQQNIDTQTEFKKTNTKKIIKPLDCGLKILSVMEEVFQYSKATFSLSLANPDGSLTQKTKLLFATKL